MRQHERLFVSVGGFLNLETFHFFHIMQSESQQVASLSRFVMPVVHIVYSVKLTASKIKNCELSVSYTPMCTCLLKCKNDGKGIFQFLLLSTHSPVYFVRHQKSLQVFI